MKSVLLILWLLASVMSARADDFYWRNGGTGDFTNGANNWFTNGVIAGTFPANPDNAFFTNNGVITVNWTASITNANAFFDTPNGTNVLGIGSSTWMLTNNFLVGVTAGSTASLAQISGTLVVTNGSRTGAFVVGQTGAGNFLLTGGTLVVDRLVVTNNDGISANSVFNFSHGTMTILNGSTFAPTNITSGYKLGLTSNDTATWNFLGGTNAFAMAGTNTFTIGGANSTGVVLVSGSGTVWSNTGGVFVGTTGSRLTISNSAYVYSSTGQMGQANTTILVTDPGTTWNVAREIQTGSGGTMVISNGATLSANALGGSGNSNTIIITGSGTVFTNRTGFFMANTSGANSQKNLMRVESGGKVFVNSTVLIRGASNSVFVSGTGSQFRTPSTLDLGNFSSNQLIIENGGTVIDTTATLGRISTATSNAVYVTGAGSIFSNTTSLVIGQTGAVNSVMTSNGGVVFAPTLNIGLAAGGSGSLLVTGSNTLARFTAGVFIGSNTTTFGAGAILVLDNGVLEATNIVTGFSNSGMVTNLGGVLQFVNANPVLITNSGGSIFLTNAVLSYRNVSAANIFQSDVSNITFQGNNTFRLNASTNSSINDYTFGTNNGNFYQHLSLLNGSTRWQSTVASTIGSGGIFSISNTTASIGGVLTNSGTINVYFSRVTYANPVVLSGAYLSDPSTNIFSTNVTITSSGYIQGSSGDVFQFERNLTLQSTASNLFNLTASTVLFTNLGGAHLLDLTGSSALDRGTNGIVQLADVTNNFAFGTLKIAGAGDTLRVTGDVNNALYVGALNLGVLANTNNLITDVNVYYDNTLLANAYLGSATYDLQGAGMLIPYGVPEPSFLVPVGIGMLAWLRRRKPAC